MQHLKSCAGDLYALVTIFTDMDDIVNVYSHAGNLCVFYPDPPKYWEIKVAAEMSTKVPHIRESILKKFTQEYVDQIHADWVIRVRDLYLTTARLKHEVKPASYFDALRTAVKMGITTNVESVDRKTKVQNKMKEILYLQKDSELMAQKQRKVTLPEPTVYEDRVDFGSNKVVLGHIARIEPKLGNLVNKTVKDSLALYEFKLLGEELLHSEDMEKFYRTHDYIKSLGKALSTRSFINTLQSHMKAYGGIIDESGTSTKAVSTIRGRKVPF